MAKPLSATFRKPFNAQLTALRIRMLELIATSAWDDLLRAQHDRAFVVAGATKADLLKDLAEAIEKAIAQGTTFETFKTDFRSIVDRHGWHGWTGEGTKAGENWRMRVIYQTNLRTSYMSGRYAQLIDGNYPFWVYRHGGSLEPRPQHFAWDGLVLPSDHPFWATHFPPNDWGCSCRVFGARTREGARRLGGKPELQLEVGWDNIVPKTGTPAGIGKGWDYAPGASIADLVNSLVPKFEQWPETVGRDFLASLPDELRAQFIEALGQRGGRS